MKKLLLLFCALLCLGGSRVWATDIVVTWESLHGWTQSSGGVGGFYWWGVHTPGDNNSIEYSLTSIQIMQQTGSDNGDNYLAIAKSSSKTTIAEGEIIAVSDNHLSASQSTATLETYNFSSGVTLKGNTTYYFVFVTSNTASDGQYTTSKSRMSLNHLGYDTNFDYGSYPYGNSNNSSAWWPYFKATLTTSAAITNYSYSCKNLAGYEFCSGTLSQASAPTVGQAPYIGGYSCQSVSIDGTNVIFSYALTTNPIASATTPAGDIATNPKYTTIESTAGNFVYYAEEGGAVKGQTDHSKEGADAHWIIVGDEANGYKFYNANTGTSKVAVVADASGSEIQMLDEASNTASLFDIRYISGAYRFYKKGTKCCTNRLSSSTLKIGIHTNVNDGSKTNVTRYSKTLTYNLYWNEEKKDDQSVSVPTGDDPADYLPWDIPYCDLTCDVDAVTTETSAVNVTMTWDGPFTISSDFSTATWYYMTNNNIHYLYYSSEGVDGYKVLITDDNLSGAGINAMWAFVGNPYDGFRVINLGAGNGKYLDLNTKADMVAATYPTYSLCEIIEGTGFFKLKNGTFYLINENNAGLAINDRAEWYNSTWAQYQVSPISFKELALDFIDDYADSHAKGHYFGVSTSTYNTVRSMYEDAASVSGNDYRQLVTYPALQLPTSYPVTGYYRIKNNSTNNYLAYGTPTTAEGNRPAGLIATASSTDAASIFKLTGSKGTYKLTTEGLNIQSQTESNVAFPGTADTGVDFVFNATTPGIVSITNVASYVDADKEGSLYEATDGWTVHGVVNGQASDAQSKWVIEDASTVNVSLTAIGDYTYATLGLPFGVTLPADVKAYILTVDGEWAIPTEISEVPAGTGVLLRGTSSSVTSATLTINDEASATTTGNKLVPTYVDITTDRVDDSGEYILGVVDGVIGFYKRKSGKKIGANKAYLSLDGDISSGSVKGILLNFDDATAIRSIDNGQWTIDNAEIYNLAGQRISKLQKGVNIVNGKKVLVK